MQATCLLPAGKRSAAEDEVRRQLAQDLLRRTARPIKQIAAAVGFRSEKSFIRAFRDWTGQSPAAWREG